MEATTVIDKRSKEYKAQATKAAETSTSPEQLWDIAFASGIFQSKALLHAAFEVPGGLVETSLYKHKGVTISLRPGDGLYCLYKGKKFYIPSANVIGCVL